MSPTPDDARSVSLRCVQCDAPAGECECWVSCGCGWKYLAGTRCDNAVHDVVRCVCPCPGALRRACADARGNTYPCRCACHRPTAPRGP